MSAIRRLLERAQPGSAGGVKAHIQRGEHIAVLIEQRFGVSHPQAWQVKHLRWALNVGMADATPATRYHYYLTARVIAAALDHWPAWEPHLRGSWTRQDGRPAAPGTAGGRPPKLAGHARCAIVKSPTGSAS